VVLHFARQAFCRHGMCFDETTFQEAEYDDAQMCLGSCIAAGRDGCGFGGRNVPRSRLGFRKKLSRIFSESELGHTERAGNQKETFCHGLIEQQARGF